METLRDFQMKHLKELKSVGYEKLKAMETTFEVNDIRIKSDQKVVISIKCKGLNALRVRSTAQDSPLSKEEELEIAKYFGDDHDLGAGSIEWVDGFDIYSNGKIVDMHPAT